MSVDPTNPYAPTGEVGAPPHSETLGIDPATAKKAEAIIKDAGQFWLAILLCFICSGFGPLIIGPWYIVRWVQWSSLAKRFPQLKDPNAPPASLQKRFQGAQWKLIVGIVSGAILFVLSMLLITMMSIAARSVPPPGS